MICFPLFADLTFIFCIHLNLGLRRRQWHPTPVLLRGKSHGWRAWWAVVHGVTKSQTGLTSLSLSLFTFMHWRRKWQPTPVFLPGEPQGWGTSWAVVYRVTQSQTWLKWLSSSSSQSRSQIFIHLLFTPNNILALLKTHSCYCQVPAFVGLESPF